MNEFRPDIVYPCHYRGSGVDRFASMVDPDIEVRPGAWDYRITGRRRH